MGSISFSRWGSVLVWGSMSIDPTAWGKKLTRPMMGLGARLHQVLGLRFSAAFTFAQSPLHVVSWQKYGLQPRYLTAVLDKPVRRRTVPAGWHRLGTASPERRAELISLAGDLTNSLYEGMRLDTELEATSRGIGEAVVWEENGRAEGVALVHVGPFTTGGTGNCSVRFAAVRSGPGAPERYLALLEAVEGLAGELGAFAMSVAVNTARRGAYWTLLKKGWRTSLQGVSLANPDEPATCHADAWVLDEWR